MGVSGNYLVLTEYVDGVLNAQMVKVDGIEIKENIYYGLRNGKVIEVN
jgi:hypothetical protein